MRAFQNRMLSGSPSRPRGPGSSRRKKSASSVSKERNPFGTIGAAAPPDDPVLPALIDLLPPRETGDRPVRSAGDSASPETGAATIVPPPVRRDSDIRPDVAPPPVLSSQ